MSEGADIARALAGAAGHPLASDLLELARERNPGVEVDFMEREGRNVLRVRTERGAMDFSRRPGDGWMKTFKDAGLL